MSYIWIGIGILILIIIGIIIAIVVLNRGNTIDIVKTLPNYKIFYPKGKSFLQLSNRSLNDPGRDFPIGYPFWFPLLQVNNSDSLTVWVFDDKNISSSFTPLPPNTKYVKLINVIYRETGIRYFPQTSGDPIPPTPSKIGYVKALGVNNPTGELYTPDGDVQSDVFRYIALGENTFQLKSSDGTRSIYIDNNGLFVLARETTQEAATFQLLLL